MGVLEFLLVFFGTVLPYNPGWSWTQHMPVQPPESWDCRCTPPCMAFFKVETILIILFLLFSFSKYMIYYWNSYERNSTLLDFKTDKKTKWSMILSVHVIFIKFIS